MSASRASLPILAYPCRGCGWTPCEGTCRQARKTVHTLECRNPSCALAPVAVGATKDEALMNWNEYNREERPI